MAAMSLAKLLFPSKGYMYFAAVLFKHIVLAERKTIFFIIKRF